MFSKAWLAMGVLVLGLGVQIAHGQSTGVRSFTMTHGGDSRISPSITIDENSNVRFVQLRLQNYRFNKAPGGTVNTSKFRVIVFAGSTEVIRQDFTATSYAQSSVVTASRLTGSRNYYVKFIKLDDFYGTIASSYELKGSDTSN